MEQSTATRRLVKSPPELWAELSSEESLGRHLAEFGEIRIVQVDPQTTVAWEGDRVSGTVELAPTGWGTKVVLTATPDDAPPDAPIVADRPPPPVAAAVARPAPAAAPPPAAAPAPRRGFFARLFGRRAQPESAIPGPPVPTPDPSPPAPAPSPGPLPPAPDPVPPTPAPGPGAPQIRAGSSSKVAPPAPCEPPGERVTAERRVAILTDVLDDLGSAHHRPAFMGERDLT